MAILLQSSMFAFTPHINKGSIEEISIEKACSELGITEAELKEFNKDFFLAAVWNKINCTEK